MDSLETLPVGTFVKGRPFSLPREGYEYTDLTCQLVYRNDTINLVALLLSDGTLQFFNPPSFTGEAVEKPADWPVSLDNWQAREREFVVRTLASRGLRPFDFSTRRDAAFLCL